MKSWGKSVSGWDLGRGKTGLEAWEEREGAGIRKREISACGWSWGVRSGRE